MPASARDVSSGIIWDVETPYPTDGYFTYYECRANCVRPLDFH